MSRDMMPTTEKVGAPSHTNQSSTKLLHLIEVLSRQPEPCRLQDIARESGMNPSTALRFLSALQSMHYVAQDIDSGRYYLTFKLCAIAQNITSHMSIRSISMPFLRNVSHIFSESCNLAVENDMSVMYVEVANDPHKTLMSTQRIGNVAPLHCTGVGKLMLSGFTYAELEQYIAIKGLPRLTPHTITTLDGLEAELAQIRKLGYAFDNEECEVGARCIAAPIRDYTGRIIAGISVSGPTVRMSDAHIFTHLPYLIETAAQLSIRLGWIPQSVI
ncbi:MAG: IclR family transcriptional regulator [Oscillospiraceae bacterium]|jgi:DNA-binding IclR family transcriptional regulator|nr:IclR family transcriptional regulator [Oscillospiraceae bacterium]